MRDLNENFTLRSACVADLQFEVSGSFEPPPDMTWDELDPWEWEDLEPDERETVASPGT